MRKSNSQIPMSPLRYTAAEDQRVSEMHARGVPIGDIAAALPRPRSYASILRRLRAISTRGTMEGRGKPARPWTEHDKAELYRVLVKENLPWPEIRARFPERSMASLLAAANKFGIARKRDLPVPWSAEEIQRLHSRMEQKHSSPPSELEVTTLFPDRTWQAVRHRWYKDRYAKRSGYVNKAGASPWTHEEDQLVLEGLAKGSSPISIAALLPNRTKWTVKWRVDILRQRVLNRKQDQ